MVVSNGYIRKDKINKATLVYGKRGTYLDVDIRMSETDNKFIVEIFQKGSNNKIGLAHPGYITEQLKTGFVGSCEMNIDRIEWDYGIWPEGHINVVMRDRPTSRGNTLLITTNEKHKSLSHKVQTLGSGHRHGFDQKQLNKY